MTASTQPARLLGVPLGDFGFFSCILLSLASGLLTFFATLFLSIVSLLVWNSATHQDISYADTYRYVAFPIGVIVMVCAFFFFLGTWIRRKFSGDR
jgi:TRAP-type C4-dicarboxylate transport system permease small subunit